MVIEDLLLIRTITAGSGKVAILVGWRGGF